jgi:hypothetical protein
VRHEHSSGQRTEQLVGDVTEGWRLADHRVGNAGEFGDPSRNRPTRVDQGIEHQLPSTPLHHDDRNLGDPIIVARPHARGLHVDHREGAFIEQRRALCRRDQCPSAVSLLPHARIRTKQCDGEPFGHRQRRHGQPKHLGCDRVGIDGTGRHQRERAFGQGAGRMRVHSDH